MFEEEQEYPVTRFNSKYEIFASNFEKSLLEYKNPKGLIKITKTGISASPYVELALGLELIVKNAFSYQLGKNGKVYNVLKHQIDCKVEQNNPFVLSTFDTVFFLEILLTKDYWFIFNILEKAVLIPNVSYTFLKGIFKQILLDEFKDLRRKYCVNKDIGDKIDRWSENDTYMEHILMPRLNWLYDMNLILLKKDLSFTPTDYGISLFESLSKWNYYAGHIITSAEEYVKKYYLQSINKVFDFNKKVFNFANDSDILNMYLDECFDLFKTLAPNRTTFSLFAKFSKMMLFFKHSIVIDEDEIKALFESELNTQYIFRYQKQYKDGYLQKIV
ncbi:MAG: hypothetical protein PUC50_00195 [Bacteroidales bacterium]|nr:hypothetical protein [Bacteroidales bacterium]